MTTVYVHDTSYCVCVCVCLFQSCKGLSVGYLQIIEVGLKISKVREDLSAERGEAAGL